MSADSYREIIIDSEGSRIIQLISKKINRMVITVSQIAITVNLVTKIVQNIQLEILITVCSYYLEELLILKKLI